MFVTLENVLLPICAACVERERHAQQRECLTLMLTALAIRLASLCVLKTYRFQARERELGACCVFNAQCILALQSL